jgi:hypothetical protein
MNREPDTAAVLADRGLPPGPEGYRLEDLAGAVEARGWRWRIDPARGGQPSRRRWRAFIFTPGGAQYARGWGPTEGEALALALARMLAQGGGPGR